MDTHAFVLDRDDEIYQLGAIDGRSYSEAIKGSLRQRITLSVEEAIGGSEDVIDLVRGREIVIRDARLRIDERQRSPQFLTAKGGIQGLRLENVELVGEPARNWDLAFGQWTLYDCDPQRPPLRRLVLDGVRHVSGRPVRVFCVKADPPELGAGDFRVTCMFRPFVSMWFALQRLRAADALPPGYVLQPWEAEAARGSPGRHRPHRASSSRRPR